MDIFKQLRFNIPFYLFTRLDHTAELLGVVALG